MKDKETEIIKISVRTSSNKNLNMLDLNAEVDSISAGFNIY